MSDFLMSLLPSCFLLFVPFLQRSAGEYSMEDVIVLFISILLIVYLLVSVIRPEKF